MGRYYETFDPPFFMERRYAFNAIAANPNGYDRPDENIITDLNVRLRKLWPLDTSRVQIICDHNHVILFGDVLNESVSKFLERIADRVLGVRSVENRLKILRAGAERATTPSIELDPFTGWTESQEKPVSDLLL